MCSSSRDGLAAVCHSSLCAITPSVSVTMSPPVPRFTSILGKADEATSSRSLCPGSSRRQVSHIAMLTSYTSPGMSSSSRPNPDRYRSLSRPSQSRCAKPFGCTLTSLAVMSVSSAEVATCAISRTGPMTSTGSVSGSLL